MDARGGKLSKKSRKLWADRVTGFLEKNASAGRQAGKLRKLQDKFLANKYHMQALDQSLRVTFGFGLDRFRVEQPAAALELGQSRFYVDIEDRQAT